MRTVRRILVAVKDPQAKSLPSITKATQLARAWGAEIELFHALDTPIYIDTDATVDGGIRGIAREHKARSLRQLEIIAARMRKHGVKVSAGAEWDFPIYEAIVRRAGKTNADLIIAECKPGHRIAPMLLRLTDWELLRFSPIPVLLIKNTRPYRHPSILAAIDPLHARAKPMKLDEEILRAGAAFQYALRGKLHAVHAYSSPIVGTTPYDILSADTTVQLHEQVKADAQVRFSRILRKANIPRARQHLVQRHPQDAIPDIARKTQSAIVVMGAISRTGLKRLLIGNTAEQLLDDLDCDVLVIKPAMFANRVPRAKRGMRLIAPQPLSSFGY